MKRVYICTPAVNNVRETSRARRNMHAYTKKFTGVCIKTHLIHCRRWFLCRYPQASLEEKRINALKASRRQREAKLVGAFDSDEIYDLADESALSMRQAQEKSRRRVQALCESRNIADSTMLVIEELIVELQSYLPRYTCM